MTTTALTDLNNSLKSATWEAGLPGIGTAVLVTATPRKHLRNVGKRLAMVVLTLAMGVR